MKFTSENFGCFVEYDSGGIITKLKLKGIEEKHLYLFTRNFNSVSDKGKLKIIYEYYETTIKSAIQDCIDQCQHYYLEKCK